MTILELPVAIAELLVYVVPVFIFGIIVTIVAIDRRGVSGNLRRAVSFLMNPFGTGVSESSEAAPAMNGQNGPNKKGGLGLRLQIAYLAIAIFLLSNLIGVFYYVMADVAMVITQDTNGLARIVTSVVVQTPFHGGWMGSLPWYGGFPLPLAGVDTFHEPWSWIFFTAFIGDNPDLFNNLGNELLLYNYVVALVFLIPLLIRPIRKSFVPSLFLLATSMVTSTRAILGCLALALKVGYLGDTLQFGTFVVDGIQLTEAIPVLIGALLPWILGLFAGYMCLGFLLSRVHFRQQRRSQYWFLAYVALSYWIGFLFLMW
ncbi:MAG: hypothetical protein ACW99U_01955 [Candidatus Thorarchaeota archaeon]|jgi:hypothetical protein